MTEAPKRSRNTVNRIFGDVLPRLSTEERDFDSPDDDAEHDRWLRDNIPPHHE